MFWGLGRSFVSVALLGFGVAHAASIAGVSPQGEVAQVRQLSVRFSEAVVPLGDPRQADPMSLACEGDRPAGAGRWVNDRTWLYDFREPLPPGTRCTLKAHGGWKPIAAAGALTGRSEFTFSTGGPAVVQTQPWAGSTIAEDQYFLLQLNGAAAPASVEANTWCEVEGIGERLAGRLITGVARDALIQARRLEKLAARTLVLSCQRPLPADARVRVVWGRGIAAVANPKVLTRSEQRFEFRVRKPFLAEFSCERERANAACLPVRAMVLRFSSPVARALAEKVRLQPAAGGTPLAPVFDKDDKSQEVEEIAFPKPLPENSRFSLVLPGNIVDAAGRSLANASSFPLAVATGDAPPIAKFAAAPFGVIERDQAALPLSLRHVQGDLRPGAAAGQVRVKSLGSDAQILAWFKRLRQHHEARLSARDLGLPEKDWFEFQQDTDARGRTVQRRVERYVATREVSLLAREADVRRLDLPQLQGGDPRPFEVIGIPLPEPGYHVVEVESQRLGAALLDKTAPMFVRTGVLVTNLGVHFKLGRENSLVWVTSLDRGQPVAGAAVAVSDCDGKLLWQGSTGADGTARIAQSLQARQEACDDALGLFVSARLADRRNAASDSKSAVDTAFVFSGWQQGIEPWRFNLPTANGPQPDMSVHTVFDRTLLRAGETVSMKHFARIQTSAGLTLPAADELPTHMKIVHEGSGEETLQPLTWSGVRHALARWNIPAAARLGLYRVELERRTGDERLRRSWSAGDFRVEEFRLPLVDARLAAPKLVPVAPKELPFEIQMNHLAGGAMARAPLRVSALLKPREVKFPGQEDFSFEPPRDLSKTGEAPDQDGDDRSASAERDGKLVADKLAFETDAQGAARAVLRDLPAIARPSELLAELTYNDPNGEAQTVSTTVPLWPSAVVLGIRAGAWAGQRGPARFGVIALDTAGRPLAGQRVEVRARLVQTISTRKRMVGGFYAYDNRTEVNELGSLCSGSTDAQGRLACEATLDAAGQVELIAQATDTQGHIAQAATSVWVTKQGELWFVQDNDDRIDVLPEKKRYEPGETARLQVRMPFREATALVAVEREGIIDSRVLRLRGNDPTIELKIDKAWGPNVYVSVLALRGRIREVPWYSLFTWGWREPVTWARTYWSNLRQGSEYQAPTALVDLAKPAFKLGVAALQVGVAEHVLQVSVRADKPQYLIREKAMARIKVTQGGQPLAGAEVAFAAVDESLLALRSNASWDLLGAMVRERPWGVETSTGQSEIIGRRHHGRKAVAAGGGGGRGGTRELFDTLLLWQPVVTLDANGEATVEVPLNDSLTSFRLVAVADAGVQRFGTGSTSIRVSQDLQVLSGLPPMVREGDRFSALLTLRNTTSREMKLRATLIGTLNGGAPAGADRGASGTVRTPLNLPAQEVTLAAGAAREVLWPVDVPADAFSIGWEAAVEEQGGASAAGTAKDRIKVTQRVAAAVPVRVLQGTLQQLDGSISWPVAAPADALVASGILRGGLRVGVQPRLSGALPGLRRFFETYPFSCLEQKVSRAIGMDDAPLWAETANALPSYLDSDGLASHFPPRADEGARGSDRLTAYLIAAAHEAGYALPEATRDRMLEGLTAFVEGRIERRFWAPKNDLDVRKLAALEALSRHGRAQPRQLGSISLTPDLWPTAAVIDWLSILRRVNGIARQAQRLDEAQQILRARLGYSGSTLKFSNEADDFWWWLMDSADANASRLILAVLDEPAWRDDLPRMVAGSLARQQRGAWLTTTANLWGALALNKFAAKFEAQAPSGKTTATTGDKAGGSAAAIDWSASPEGGTMGLPWPSGAGTLRVTHEGAGKPWVSVQSLAAIPLKAPLRAGYGITRSVTAVQQKTQGRWSRGDIARVRLEIDAYSDMSWVVVSDPVPGGASVLGSGLGRDSAIAARGQKREGSAWPAFEERSFEAFRSYFEHLPRGRHVVEYTVRLNNPGRFTLPPTRVEAMYAPESFAESPNAALEVAP
jgi:uncharacterized protein YfaS (alpha-2-macroglobulin family)